MSNLMFEIILQTIFIIISVTFDILIFDRISLSARNKKDKRDCKIVCVRMNDSLNLFL